MPKPAIPSVLQSNTNTATNYVKASYSILQSTTTILRRTTKYGFTVWPFYPATFLPFYRFTWLHDVLSFYCSTVLPRVWVPRHFTVLSFHPARLCLGNTVSRNTPGDTTRNTKLLDGLRLAKRILQQILKKAAKCCWLQIFSSHRGCYAFIRSQMLRVREFSLATEVWLDKASGAYWAWEGLALWAGIYCIILWQMIVAERLASRTSGKLLDDWKTRP